MSKLMCRFSGSKVGKTLIFYTHVSIAKQEKSPMTILTESAGRAIRMVRFIFFRKQEKILKQVQDDGLLDGMTNVVRQSVERLLRHVVPRNDGKGLCHAELSSASGRILKQVQDDGLVNKITNRKCDISYSKTMVFIKYDNMLSVCYSIRMMKFKT